MGYLIKILFICILGSHQFASASALKGTWRFSEMFYKNQRMPLPNPELFLTWTFFDNGTERLYWSREPNKYCERFGSYELVGNYLVEETLFLNPKNDFECSADPDMRLGRKTQTPIQFYQDEIWLTFNLSDEELVYILKPYN